MSTVVERRFDPTWPQAALAGALAGLVRPAGVALLSLLGLDPGLFEFTIQHELPMWWAVHVGYSVAFALLYDWIANLTRLRRFAGDPATGAALGLAFGAVLWAVNVVVAWTVVTSYLLPLLATEGSLAGPLVGHLVYGLVLGAGYPLLSRV
jgi:hypothetical protein